MHGSYYESGNVYLSAPGSVKFRRLVTVHVSVGRNVFRRCFVFRSSGAKPTIYLPLFAPLTIHQHGVGR